MYMMIVAAMWAVLIGTVARAQDDGGAQDATAPAAEKSYGVGIDMTVASIYNFRGINVFKEDAQMDSHAAFFPSINWAILNTGLYVGYWGAYQLSGDNRRDVIRNALGHEQDLFVGYDKGFKDDLLTLSTAFTYYFYPFASEAVNGSKNPSLIEPLIGVSLATKIDFGLNLSFFAGLGDMDVYSHLYIKPWMGKSFSFGEAFGMDLGLSAGFKVWTDEATREAGNNVVDIAFNAGFPISMPDGFYVTPAISAAWTNLHTNADGTKALVGDEYMVYGSLSAGAEF